MDLKRSEIPNGVIEFFSHEVYDLARALAGSFSRHLVLDGAEVIRLDQGIMPAEIQHIVRCMGGRNMKFHAVKTARGIPFHRHNKPAIYFGGEDGSIVLTSGPRNEIGRFDLQSNRYLVVRPGNWHGVTVNRETIFFAVKFTQWR